MSEIPYRGPYGFEENYSTDTSEENNNDTSEENDSGTSDTDPYTGYFPCTGPDTDTADENNNDTSEENDTGTYNTLPYFGPYIFTPCTVPDCETCNVPEDLCTTPASAIHIIANLEQNSRRTRADLTEAQDRTEQDHRVAFYGRPLQTRREIEPHIRFLIRQGIQEAVLRNIARADEVIEPGRTGRVLLFWDTAARLIHIFRHRTY